MPVMVSGTITDKSGRLLSDNCPRRSGIRCGTPDRSRIGFNCALGAEDLRAHIADIGRVADALVCAYPNAGLPNEFGQYDESPEYMARLIGEFAASGLVNVVGGCCGTTPDHNRRIAAAVAPHKPRAVPVIEPRLRLSGLEPFRTYPAIPFVNIGERTTSRGRRDSASWSRPAITPRRCKWRATRSRTAAQIIDVNMDEGLLDSEAAMVTFLTSRRRRTGYRPRPGDGRFLEIHVIEAGLNACRASGGEFDLDEGRRGEILSTRPRSRRRHGAAVW